MSDLGFRITQPESHNVIVQQSSVGIQVSAGSDEEEVVLRIVKAESQSVLVQQATGTVEIQITGGIPGAGMPMGGVTGDILSKASSVSYDFSWTDAPTLDSVNFDLAASEASAVGRLSWNDTDGTLDLGLKGGNVSLQIGQETVHMVVNKTGATIPEGAVVALDGSSGQRVGVKLAIASSESGSSRTFGVATEQILDNHTGFVTSEGFVRNINTSSLSEGALIWLSPTTAGGMTTTKPSAPNHLVLVGICVTQANNGIIAVHIQNGYELDELHNVLLTASADGDVLKYDASTGLWKNGQPAPSGFYQYTQAAPATHWVIIHGLGYRPSVTTFDSSGNEIEGSLTHQSQTQCTVVFEYATSGTATLS